MPVTEVLAAIQLGELITIAVMELAQRIAALKAIDDQVKSGKKITPAQIQAAKDGVASVDDNVQSALEEAYGKPSDSLPPTVIPT